MMDKKKQNNLNRQQVQGMRRKKMNHNKLDDILITQLLI